MFSTQSEAECSDLHQTRGRIAHCIGESGVERLAVNCWARDYLIVCESLAAST